MLVGCLWLMLALNLSGHAAAQDGLNHATQTKTVSKKEQLVRSLEALRAAESERAVVSTPTEPSELFLDLTTISNSNMKSESAQAMAATLDLSVTSSPTQVIMRAVAWISIVLCVCCLIVLGTRRWQRQRGLLPTTTSRSRVLETLSLGPSRTVSLIEMHGYRALVATDAGGIRSLVLAPATFEENLQEEQEMTTDNST